MHRARERDINEIILSSLYLHVLRVSFFFRRRYSRDNSRPSNNHNNSNKQIQYNVFILLLCAVSVRALTRVRVLLCIHSAHEIKIIKYIIIICVLLCQGEEGRKTLKAGALLQKKYINFLKMGRGPHAATKRKLELI